MSKVKTKLIEDIRRKTGKDATDVIDYLYEMGTLDDCLVRQHVAKREFVRRLTTSDASERTIMEDIAFELGFTRIRVFQLVSNAYPRG